LNNNSDNRNLKGTPGPLYTISDKLFFEITITPGVATESLYSAWTLWVYSG